MFVSCVHRKDDPFSLRVRNALSGKLADRFDDNGRLVAVMDARDREAGLETPDVVPWDTPPTDVIVLLSDAYITDKTKKPELDLLLGARQKEPELQLWIGIVQNTR